MCVAPQVMEAPGAKLATGVVRLQVPSRRHCASATVTSVKVTLPELVAMIEVG